MRDVTISEPILRRIKDLAARCCTDETADWHLEKIRSWLRTEQGYRETLAEMRKPGIPLSDHRSLETTLKGYERGIAQISKDIYKEIV